MKDIYLCVGGSVTIKTPDADYKVIAVDMVEYERLKKSGVTCIEQEKPKEKVEPEQPNIGRFPTWGELMTVAKRNHNTAQAVLDAAATRLQTAQFELEDAKALEDEARRVYEYAKTLRELPRRGEDEQR